MQDKVGPWRPAILCGGMVLIMFIGNLAGMFSSGNSTVGYNVLMFLPVCFIMAGSLIYELQSENRELKARLDAIEDEQGRSRDAA